MFNDKVKGIDVNRGWLSGVMKDFGRNKLMEIARSKGFDGIVVEDAEFDHGSVSEVVVPNSSQIKSAKAVVLGDDGKVVPLSKRFSSSDDVRFDDTAPVIKKASSDSDEEYMKAVEAGEMATCQKMVDEAAREAGYSMEVFRGDSDANNIFEYHPKDRQNFGIFTTQNKGIADSYSKSGAMARRFYLKAPRVLDLTDCNENVETYRWVHEWAKSFDEWIDPQTGEPLDPADAVAYGELHSYEGDWSMERWDDLQATAKTDGYDALIVPDWHRHEGENVSVVVFDSSSLKLADAVTKDGQGNVIPLSKRFDSGSSDIRFDETTPVIRTANEVGLPYNKHVFGLTDDNGHSESYVGDAMGLHSDFKWNKSLLLGRTWRYIPSTGNICIWDEFTPEVESGIVDHLADRYGIEDARISTPELRRTAGANGANVPDKIGTMPIPEGHVRLYHYTNADPEAIRKEGLRLSMAKGSTYGEPNMVWASSIPMTDSKNVVEFSVPVDDPSMSLERPDKGQDPAEWMKGNHHVGFGRDIRPEEILTIHEPWHKFYRYIKENPRAMKDVYEGKLDDLDAMRHPHEFRAVQEIKNEIGAVAGGRTVSASSEKPSWIPDEKHRKAIEGTPGARLLDEGGFEVEVERNQHPDQAGRPSVRSGVFWQPSGSPNKFPYSGKHGYGGLEKIKGILKFKNPMFVRGATGGRAPQLAYDAVVGKGSYDKMRNDVLKLVQKDIFGGKIYEDDIYKILEEFDGDVDAAYDIYSFFSRERRGNGLAYAIQENIVANVVRNAGYDAIVGWSQRRDGTPFLSEVFDLTMKEYPSKWSMGRIASNEQMEFNLDIQTNSKPIRLEDINALRPEIAAAANKILDAWQQDADGIDEEFGSGGACDAIAHKIQGVLSQHGYDVSEGGQDGDDHAWVVVYDEAIALAIDIPPGVYETGAGYSWKKIEGSHVNPEDIQIGTTWREAIPMERQAGVADQDREHPVAAAIIAAGRVFEGRTHFEALQKAKMLGYVEDGDDGNLVDRNGKVMNYDGSIDLFITNKGRLISRFQAAAMNEATGAEYIPEKDRDDVDTIIKRHSGVEARVSERDNGTIVLDHLQVPRESRSEGLGSAFMQDLCAYADRRGKDIELSLGDKRPGETTSKGRLIKFYGRFGFVRNFGRTTDYGRSCQMYRRPQGKKAAGLDFELMVTSAVKDGWLGNSKVVDANGNPLVVYHGSRNPMTEDFSHDLEGTGVASGGNGQTKYGGFFFTSEPDNAQFFADPKELNELNPDLVSSYGQGDEWYYSASDDEGNDWLNGGKFKTPELAEKAGQAHVKRFNEALQRQEDMFVRGYNLRIENPLEIGSKEMGSNKWSPPMLIPLAKDAGKDGVIIRGYQDGAMESNIYIVFDGSQIRPSKMGQLKAADDQSFEIVITSRLNADTGVDDAPAAGHLDTQLFEGCKGTKFDRDVVGKYRRRLKKHKVKKAQAEVERDINGEMIAELEAEYWQKWTPVTSSMIREVAYDIKTGELTFKMRNHAEYSFRNVPKSEYDAFMAAESKGKWFADFRKRYRESKAIEDRAMRSEAKTSGGLAKTAASWGTAGSGVMYFCPDDNSVLLLKRSQEVMDGGLWGIPGGAVKGTEGMYDDDELDGKDFDEETLRSSAHKEVEEEMGHVPDGKDAGSVMIPFGKFKYTTFFKSVGKDQKEAILEAVELNWESTDKRWFSLAELPRNVHPGVAKAVELKFGKRS